MVTEPSRATLQYLLLCPVVRVFRIPITAGALFLPFLHECLQVVMSSIIAKRLRVVTQTAHTHHKDRFPTPLGPKGLIV